MKQAMLIQLLQDFFPGQIDTQKDFPKPYWNKSKDPKKVKAVYLGCDPTNKGNIQFDYAFAHGCNNPGFKRFVTLHTKQLKAIGLDRESVYTQNLCQNYFKEETSRNIKIWKEAAIKVWIPVLKAELDNLFDSSIPVLLTSQLLLDVLLNEDLLEGNKRPAKYDAANFYKPDPEIIPVPANQNKLERPLIPLYRGRNPKTGESYLLSDKSNIEYTMLVKQLL